MIGRSSALQQAGNADVVQTGSDVQRNDSGQLLPGSALGLTHGGRSPRQLLRHACEVEQETRAAAPYLTDPRFAGSVRRKGLLDAMASQLGSYIAKVGVTDKRGAPRPAALALLKTLESARREDAALMLTPAAAAKGGRAIAAANRDVARMMAEMDDEQPQPLPDGQERPVREIPAQGDA